MALRPTPFLLGSILIYLGGCCTNDSLDPVAQFRRRHPIEARAYTYIHPVSTETSAMVFRVKSVTITGIGQFDRDAWELCAATTPPIGQNANRSTIIGAGYLYPRFRLRVRMERRRNQRERSARIKIR